MRYEWGMYPLKHITSHNEFVPGRSVLLAALALAEEPLRFYHENAGIQQAELIRQTEQALDFDGARITGGSAANLGQYPYMGGLVITLQNGQTSVARQFVVVLGSTRLFSGGTRITTTNVVMHGSWNPNNLNNDVAVIVIGWVNFSNTIRNIGLASGSNSFQGAWAQAAGFGRTSDLAGISNNQFLSHVTLQVIGNAECQRTFGNSIIGSTICTSGAGGRSTCPGDSGGPLLTSNVLFRRNFIQFITVREKESEMEEETEREEGTERKEDPEREGETKRAE
ncbi:unnamed protein product, partial [Iphiclides podalirius]